MTHPHPGGQNERSFSVMAGCLLVLAGCTSGPICAEPPRDGPTLAEWLADRCYLDWAGEDAVRPSDMAAGGARVFVNPALDRSSAFGRDVHPVGAAAVREIYHEDLRTLRGWAVAVKVADAGDDDDWLWAERWVDSGTTVARRGAPGCVGCHRTGTDFVQSR